MKRLLFFLFAFVCWYAQGQNIMQLEYFIDADPGYGNATNVAITAAPALSDFKFTIPLTSLSDGLHTLYVRTKNANGKWSVIQNRNFVKVGIPANVSRIEYFFDTALGYGNGTSVPFTSGTSLTDFIFDIPLSSLGDGLHTLFIRIKNANNKWSVVQSRSFVKLGVPANVARVEYFIDTDPGYGNGTLITYTAGTSVTDLTFDVPMTSLSENLHTLFVRVKDVNGRWSTLQSRTFVKIPMQPNVTRVEYYIDTDPGVGSATAVSFAPAPVVTDLNFSINVSSVSNGTHKLYVRVKNEKNTWSPLLSQDFTVCNLSAPATSGATLVNTFGFTANWTAISGATSYQLDVSANDFATFYNGYNGKTVTGTSFVVTGLGPNTTYKYRLRAAGTCTSANSNVIEVTTSDYPVPVAINATAITTTGFTANWNPVEGVTGYLLTINANDGTAVPGYESKQVTTSSAIITGLSPNTTYKYFVRTLYSGYVAKGSNTITVITQACNVVAPVLSEATNVTGTSFKISWSTVPNATNYRLFMNSDGSDIYSYIARTSETTYTYQDATLATTYYYFVLSESGTCISPSHPNRLSVTTLNCNVPSKPTITINGKDTGILVLTSSASSGNQWYKDGTAITGATNITLAVTQPGLYKVNVTVTGGCISEFSNEVPIVVTAIEPVATNEITLYPNPVENELTIYGLDKITYSKLTDTIGREHLIKFDADTHSHRANVEYLSSGLYLLCVQDGDAFRYIRFVKK